ncbi:MAG: diguanylate cyclase [Anaerolineaceae bacterium]
MLKIPGMHHSPKVPAVERVYQPELLDSETGLFGADLFMDMVQRDIERSLRYGGEMTLMVFDVAVAAFHPSATEPEPPSLAPTVAEILRDIVRRSDIPARLGESRFAVLLSSAEQPGVEQFSERIRTRIGTEPYARDAEGNGIHARAWAGTAPWTPEFERADELVAAAVHAMNESRAGYEQVQDWFKGTDPAG